MTPAELDEAIKALPKEPDLEFSDSCCGRVADRVDDYLRARLALVLQVVREYTEAVDDLSNRKSGDSLVNLAKQLTKTEANLRTILQLEDA